MNALDFDARSPLHSSAWMGNDRVTEMLLFYGASVDHACKQGATALGIASQEKHEKCVSILLQYGANPLKSDQNGRTPIKLATKSNNFGVLRLLENALKSRFKPCNNDSSKSIRHFSNIFRSHFSFRSTTELSP